MLISNINNFSSMSAVKAKVDIYLDTTLVKTCTCSDMLEKFKINRDGNSNKFFGFGVCHKLEVDFIDLNRELDISKANNTVVCLGDGTTFDCPYPKFYITEVKRDEKTNSITATAHDKLYNASEHTLNEVTINTPYTVRQLLDACASFLGITAKIENVSDTSFNTSYAEGGNFSGDEDLRKVFDAIAEVTQTIYYLNSNEELVFKRLDKDGEAVHTVTKDNYYELNIKTAKKLTGICSATELGDNLEASTGEEGIIQYVRNNPLWDLHPDRAELVDNALASIGGISINQFYCDWAGDYRLEIGDKLAFIKEDSNLVESYLICDAIEYAGTLSQITEWEYTEQPSETASNPTSIGERINQTVAKVDKVNQSIELVVKESNENASKISQIGLNLDSINASVQSVEKNLANIETTTDARLDTITREVGLKLDKEAVEITVASQLQSGVDKVVTASKKYTFDDSGLNVSSSSNSISTKITEDGMAIQRGYEEVLRADNQGVRAEDLHATTYLIIGETSRLEDMDGRTACFWIGD